MKPLGHNAFYHPLYPRHSMPPRFVDLRALWLRPIWALSDSPVESW